MPAIGATVTYDATFDSYTPNPPMITLSDGEPPAKAALLSRVAARRTLKRQRERATPEHGVAPPEIRYEGSFIAFLPETYSAQLAFMLLSMICWGSWANTIKLTPGWPIQLFYWDYVVGILLGSLAWGITLGGGPAVLFPAIAGADSKHLLLALAGGIIFNAANLLLVVAIEIAGLAVAFPLGIGWPW